MNTIYVVSQCWSDYDSSASFPILATPNNLIAETRVTRMQERLAARNLVSDNINKHMAEWEVTNPRPRIQTIRQKSFPDYGPKRSKWTKKQLDEYKAVQQENEDARTNAIKPMKDWTDRRFAEQTQFTEAFSQEEQNDLRDLHSDPFWVIDDVPYEE
jgi:glutamyl-tRNA reductase